MENFGDVGDVESFLSNDGEDARSLYGTIKQNLTEHKTESSKGKNLVDSVVYFYQVTCFA